MPEDSVFIRRVTDQETKPKWTVWLILEDNKVLVVKCRKTAEVAFGRTLADLLESHDPILGIPHTSVESL